MKDSILKNKKYAVLSVAAILLIWAAAAMAVQNSVKIPSPAETAQAFILIISDSNFYRQVLTSLGRILIGFGISFGAALVLGIIAGFVAPVYYLLHPIVLAQRAMPTMGVILLALIWLNREVAPILVGILIIFPIIYGAVVNAIQNIDFKLLEMAQVYRLKPSTRIKHIYLPSIRSALAAVSSAAISLNVKVGIAAEVLSQPRYAIGTGFVMEKAALNTAGVLAWSLVAIMIAGGLELLVKIIFHKKN